MPVYAYKGVTSAGKSTRGTVTAESARAARSKMRGDGVILTDLAEARGGAKEKAEADGGSGFSLDQFRRIPPMERAVATRQLSTLVGSGIPLVEALGALVEQIEHARLKTVMSAVRERVNEGANLADAMQATGQFDNLYISMIRSGEASGALDTVLARVADYLEEQVRLSNKIGSIVIYPAAMLGFALLVIAVLVTVVLPQITGLLESLDQPLPWYTKIILTSSDFARSYWWAMILVGIALYAGFRAAVATERGRNTWDQLKLQLPIMGRIVRVVSIARFSRTLATLLASGVGIVQALDIGRHVANNTIMAGAIDTAKSAILEGASLAAPLKQSGQFPPMVTTMIEVGERSGELDSMLMRVADTYEEQVETTVTRMTALLEPALILVMVLIVLVIILATLMPLLQITSSLS